jgi:hypothetical protein
MNYFEQELRRVAKACDGITNPTFAGRACYGELGGDNRAKLQFVAMGTHEKYEALKATILNRSDGEVDSLLFRFGDVWGNKTVGGLYNAPPRIWTYQSESEWYSYYPTDADIKQLAEEVGAYLAVFTDRSIAPEKTLGEAGTDRSTAHEKTLGDAGGKESVLAKIRESKKAPAQQNEKPSAKKKQGPEI